MADSSKEALSLKAPDEDILDDPSASPSADQDLSGSCPPDVTEPTKVPIVYNDKSSLESRSHEIHNIKNLIEAGVQRRLQDILPSTSMPRSRSPRVARLNSRTTQRQELWQSLKEANTPPPPRCTTENTTVRARLTAINSKLEELPREDSVIEGSILFDALTWTAEHSIGDALPPYPKYFGEKELLSVERSKIDLSSYPRGKAHELRDKISCLITEELSQKVGSTPTFIKILKRLSLRFEKAVLLDIHSWRDPHRASEFDEIKFRGLPGGQNSKRNDRMNALQ